MIKQLRGQGAHFVDIAHRIGCSERTVRRYLALPAPPTGKPKQRRPSKLDPYKPFIDEQLGCDVWNAEVIRGGPRRLDSNWTKISAFLHHKQQAVERSNETKETYAFA